ncbi:hypothetical protein AX15_006247 [Amanita polypyramis BW_CC]|nr:hypothetical protein AX15_006247 [Amanita polypyramis BW_CC]
MSVATPTLLQRPLKFPELLPKPPQPHPVPLSRRRVYGHLNAVRDLQREMDDLSEEENELEDITLHIHNRGFNFLIPIGCVLTQQEEKNDADEETEGSGSEQSDGGQSLMEDDGENDSNQDLDASMDDLDEDITPDSEDNLDQGDLTEDLDDDSGSI